MKIDVQHFNLKPYLSRRSAGDLSHQIKWLFLLFDGLVGRKKSAVIHLVALTMIQYNTPH